MSIFKMNFAMIVVFYAVSAIATPLHGAYCGFPNVHDPWMLPFQHCNVRSKGQQACESTQTFNLASGALISCKWYEPNDSTVFEYKSFCGKAGDKDPWVSDAGIEYCNDNKETYTYDEEQCINTLGPTQAYECIWKDNVCHAMTGGGTTVCGHHEEEIGCIATSYVDDPNCQWYAQKDTTPAPSMSMTSTPSLMDSSAPSVSISPSNDPSLSPSMNQIVEITTAKPSPLPTQRVPGPYAMEALETAAPRERATADSILASDVPSGTPSFIPSVLPSTAGPSAVPSGTPSIDPTMSPSTTAPSIAPSVSPSKLPSFFPSTTSPTTIAVTVFPTLKPTNGPSEIITPEPTFPLFTARPTPERSSTGDDEDAKTVNTTAATLATAGVLIGLFACCLICWRKCCLRCGCCPNMMGRNDHPEEFYGEDNETFQNDSYDHENGIVHDVEGCAKAIVHAQEGVSSLPNTYEVPEHLV